MNAPKLALASVATIGGLIGLGVLVALKILDDCARRNDWR